MRIGNPQTQPVPVAPARTAQATAGPRRHPASSLLYQVLSALAWNG